MENERLERERNWVTERFKCTVESVFKELVVVIESDIEKFDKLAGEKQCTITHVDERNVTFSRKERVASISTNSWIIKATLSHNKSQLFSLEIRPEWNDAEIQCDLYIERDRISAHRISQKIIGGLLFPSIERGVV